MLMLPNRALSIAPPQARTHNVRLPNRPETHLSHSQLEAIQRGPGPPGSLTLWVDQETLRSFGLEAEEIAEAVIADYLGVEA